MPFDSPEAHLLNQEISRLSTTTMPWWKPIVKLHRHKAHTKHMRVVPLRRAFTWSPPVMCQCPHKESEVDLALHVFKCNDEARSHPHSLDARAFGAACAWAHWIPERSVTLVADGEGSRACVGNGHAARRAQTVGHALCRGAHAHQCCSRLHIGSDAPLHVLGYLQHELAMELELDRGHPGMSLACFYGTVEDTCSRMGGGIGTPQRAVRVSSTPSFCVLLC